MLEEIFSTQELASSNISGDTGKDKLDQDNIGPINSKNKQFKMLITAR